MRNDVRYIVHHKDMHMDMPNQWWVGVIDLPFSAVVDTANTVSK